MTDSTRIAYIGPIYSLGKTFSPVADLLIATARASLPQLRNITRQAVPWGDSGAERQKKGEDRMAIVDKPARGRRIGRALLVYARKCLGLIDLGCHDSHLIAVPALAAARSEGTQADSQGGIRCVCVSG